MWQMDRITERYKMENYNKIQRRSIDETPVIQDNEKNIVSGYALKFNTLSCDLGGYIETIDRQALDESIIQHSDILAFINHDERLGVLARSRYGKGKLQLSIDHIGLRYEFKLSNSPVCQQLRQYLEDEIITKSSFAFTVDKYEWVNNPDGSEYFDENGLQRLVIKRFDKLYDVSCVYSAAYDDTEAKLRTANTIDIDIVNQLTERQNNAVQRRKNHLNQYYQRIRKKYGIK